MTVPLQASLLSHARYFDQLVDMIPAKHYTSDDVETVNIKYLKKNKREEAKAAFKQQYKQNKKRKLDPETAVTTLGHLKKKQAQLNQEETISSQKPSSQGGRNFSREELELRLQARLEALRRERKEQATQEAAKNAKQWRQQKLESNALNQKRKQLDKDRTPASVTPSSTTKDAAKTPINKQPQVAPVDVNLTFGRVEVDAGAKTGSKFKKKPSAEQMLQRAEERKKQLEELKAAPDGKEKLKEQSWSSALQRARGEKVLDNPKLLKKALKREAKKKNKSSSAWKERVKVQMQAMDAKQQRRKDNLDQRRNMKLETKKAKREKKLLGPGFEGRKQGFIGTTSTPSK